MSHLFGDRPISHPEHDALGFSSFADALATSLLEMSPKDGLVISVEGPWGAGKSSAIALAVRNIKLRILSHLEGGREDLEKMSEADLDREWEAKSTARRTHIVRFNPWNFSGQENLVRAFFKELAAQIDAKPQGVLVRARNWMAGYLPSLGGGAAATAALATGHVAAAGAAGAAGRAVGEFVERAFKSEEPLEAAKKNLAAALREADERIIVIIDDLDRLLPGEMRAVLSLVKSLGDLPNVLYLLAFDAAIVHRALADSAEKIDPAFLEKIVQVSLKLPPPWRDELRGLFFSRLNPIIGNAEPADNERWRRMLIDGIDPYLETPRDVTRLVNALQVIWPNVAGDIDLADLIAITTLQLFEPMIYDVVRSEIEIITHANYRYENEEGFGKRLDPVGASNYAAAKALMALMFPRLGATWKHLLAGLFGNYVVQKAQRRICTKEYYRNYFIFGRDPRMISSAEVEEIILSSTPSAILGRTLRSFEGDSLGQRPSRVATLIDQIGEALYMKPLLTPELLRAILDRSDDLIRREDEAWELFVTRNEDRLETLCRFGLEKLDANGRTAILGVLVDHTEGLQLRTSVVEQDARRHGLFGGDEKHESERLFTTSEIEAAAAAILGQISAACEDGSIWRTPRPIGLIWARWRMGDREALAAWLGRIFADDDLIVRFAEQLPSRSYQSGGGGARIVWIFNRERFSEMFDVENLYMRLAELASHRPDAASMLDHLHKSEENNRG